MRTRIEQRARKLCTHTIVFTDLTERMVVLRAIQGQTTKSIAREFDLTPSEVQYRILKAQKSLNTQFRRNYRFGEGAIAKKMLQATAQLGLSIVDKQVAPKFIPFARSGVPRT